jgi:hypothetical protein
LVETEVVPDAREHGSIRGERNGSQGTAISLKAVHEFGREVLGVGSAPTIAAKKNLPAAFDGLGHSSRDGGDPQCIFLAESQCDGCAILEDGSDRVFHRLSRTRLLRLETLERAFFRRESMVRQITTSRRHSASSIAQL